MKKLFFFALFCASFVLPTSGADDQLGFAIGEPHSDPYHFGVAAGWNHVASVGAQWVRYGLLVGAVPASGSALHPTFSSTDPSFIPARAKMTVTEYAPAPTPSAPPPTTPPPSGIQPSVALPSNYSLTWNQDFTQPSYKPFNTASIVSLTGSPGSIWLAENGIASVASLNSL